MKLQTVTLSLLALAIATAPAYAMKCGPKEQIEKVLQSRFKEHLHSAGTAGDATNGAIFMLYISDSGSWTIARRTARHPNALCVMASGSNWAKATKPKGAVH